MSKKPWTILPPEEVTDFIEFNKRMEKVRDGSWDKESAGLPMFKNKKEICGDE